MGPDGTTDIFCHSETQLESVKELHTFGHFRIPYVPETGRVPEGASTAQNPAVGAQNAPFRMPYGNSGETVSRVRNPGSGAPAPPLPGFMREQTERTGEPACRLTAAVFPETVAFQMAQMTATPASRPDPRFA
jgi:hypothetical protein